MVFSGGRGRDRNLLMLKKVLIFVFVLLCLAVAGIYVVTRPWFVARAVRSLVNAQVKEFQLRDLSFGKIHVDGNGLVTISDTRFTLQLPSPDGQKWQGQVPVVYLDNLRSLAKSETILVSVERLDAATDGAQLKGISSQMTVTLANSKWHIPKGSAKGDFFSASGVTFTSLEAYFSGNENLLLADSWRAQWAGGNLSGRLTVTPQNYTIQANVSRLELSEVAPNMRGRVNGSAEVEIQKSGNAVSALKGHFDAPQGAQIPAAFLQPVLAYIPASTQRDILEELIAPGRDVLFDHADVRLKSVQSDSLNLLVKMDSKKLNLDLAVTIDLNVEGGLKSLIERLPQFISG